MAGGGGNENYQVSFVDGDNVISTVDVDKNSYVKEPAAPTKDGYIFAGWYADSAYTKAFDFKNTKITSDTKIYAKFVSEDEKFTVSFDSNGGSSVASQTVNAGEKVTKPTDPTKANFIFAGWYCDADLTEAYDFNTPVLSNITLYAKWTAESGTFTITFNSNGGSAVPAQTVKAGEKAVKPANPTKSGFTFSGWYSDATLTTQYNFNSAVTANITLYAKWTTSGGGSGGPVGPTYYMVTFDPMDGSFIGDTSATISIRVASGGTITNLPEVTKLGLAFLGWQTSSGDPFTSSTKITSDCTVYAQWSEDKIVNILSGGGSATTAAEVNNLTNLASSLVEGAEKSGSNTIIIDANSDGVVYILISKKNLSTLNAAMNGSKVNSLTFITGDGSVTLNSVAVSSLVDSNENNVSIKVEDVKTKIDPDVKGTVGDNPVFEVSITGDNGTTPIHLKNGSKLTITVPYDEGFDPTNCKVYYVTSEGVIEEAYDILIDTESKTITFTTGHNSYYAILPTNDADLVKHAVNSVNAWMKSASLNELFSFSIDPSDSNKITLTIDADMVFGDNNALQNMNPEAFNGLLTNFGNLVNALFGDTTISVTVNNQQNTSANTIFDKGVIDAAGLKDFILDFGYGFFEIISTMDADISGNYLFKTMDVTLGDSSTFNVDIVFTGTNMPSIQSFASTVANHISMSISDSGRLNITLIIPDKLMQSAYDKAYAVFKPGMSKDQTFTVELFKNFINDNSTVYFLVDNMADLKIDDVLGGDPINAAAANRIFNILNDNTVFINKVLSKITSLKVTDVSGAEYDLFKMKDGHVSEFVVNAADGNDAYQSFMIALKNMLGDQMGGVNSTEIKKAIIGNFSTNTVAADGSDIYKVTFNSEISLIPLGMADPFTLSFDVYIHMPFNSITPHT